MQELDLGGGRAKARRFRTTHWSLVTAARGGSTPEARAALSELCQRYWFPVYAYIRRCGYPAADAEDLTQDFFAAILEKDTLAGADPERGRFRSYLVGCLRHFLANRWDRSRARSRKPEGGWVPLDQARAERELDRAVDRTNPETLYLRDWANVVLKRAEATLEEEYRARGRGLVFELLRGFVAAEGDETSYRAAARELDTPEVHVRVQVSRMRKRFRQLIRAEVGQTVSTGGEVEQR